MNLHLKKPSLDASATAPEDLQAGAGIMASTPSGGSPFHSLLEVLRGGKRLLVCSHTRPDGDAVGSMLALGMFLGQMGKCTDLVTADRVPLLYRRLPGANGVRSSLRIDGTSTRSSCWSAMAWTARACPAWRSFSRSTSITTLAAVPSRT